MDIELLRYMGYCYPNESMEKLLDFYEKFPDVTINNVGKLFEQHKENLDLDLKALKERCEEYNNKNGIYFKFTSEQRIVFFKYHNFRISDENITNVSCDVEDIVISPIAIIFHESKESNIVFNTEKFTHKYKQITKQEYDRVLKQNKKLISHNFEIYGK